MLSPCSEAMPARRIPAEKSGDSSVPETGGEPADHRTGVGDCRLWAVGAPKTSFRTAPCRTCRGNILLAREADFPATIADPPRRWPIARESPCCPRPKRPRARAHPHRPALPERHGWLEEVFEPCAKLAGGGTAR